MHMLHSGKEQFRKLNGPEKVSFLRAILKNINWQHQQQLLRELQ
jgi:hypothetical protein